jgi:ribosome maturation factor RimP
VSHLLEKEFLPLFEEEGVEVLEFRETGWKNRPVFRVVVDRRDQEISIDDCAQLARKLQRHLSEHALAQGDWRLEVSSPGIGYPLQRPWQFRKNRGRLLKIGVSGEDGPREVTGRLMAVKDTGIEVETPEGLMPFGYGSIAMARVLPEIQSSMKGKKKR